MEASANEVKFPAPTPGIRIKLGGQERTLRYDQAALCRLEDEQGMTIRLMGSLLGELSLRGLQKVLWAGLLHESPKLAVADTLELIELERFNEIHTAVSRAVDQTFPDIVALGGAQPGKP